MVEQGLFIIVQKNLSLEVINDMIPLRYVDILLERYPELSEQRENIINAYLIFEECYVNGGKVLVAGNGGSAADSEHIVGELMKGFENSRKISKEYGEELMRIDPEMGEVLVANLQGSLPAIALDGHIALSTAYINDCEPLLCFAQQVNGFGTEKDVFWAISTSGNSSNILYAATVAKAKKMRVVGLTGAKASKLSSMADVTIYSSHTKTYMVQEHHLPIYHCLCLMLEEKFFGGK